jgi:general L-amino acid transport system substrate-binding protein
MKVLAAFTGLALACFTAEPLLAGTTEDIRSSGILTCGLDAERPGFSVRSPDYKWTGFDVDICLALAAVVLGDSSKINFVAMQGEDGVLALQAGEIDVLFSGLPWVQGADVRRGLMFVTSTFLEPLDLFAAAGTENSAFSIGTICSFKSTPYRSEFAQIVKAREADPGDATCSGWMTRRLDNAGLENLNVGASGLERFPGYFGSVAYGPLVRQGDDQWFHVVRSTLLTIMAVLGGAPDPQVDDALLLGSGWQERALNAVGSYDALFEKHFGADTAFNLKLDAPSKEGGMQRPSNAP